MTAKTRTETKTDAPVEASATEDAGVKDAPAAASEASETKDTKTAEPTGATATTATTKDAENSEPELTAEESAALEAELDAEEARLAKSSAGVGSGAGAIVSAGLGLVALTGGWTGRVLAERETLVGQLSLSKASDPAAQIDGLYGNAWHTTALVNGGFALLALLVGVGVLLAVRSTSPAAAPRPVWIKAVAWGGVALAVIGLLISAGMYFDLFAAMPSAPAATPTPAG
ncbi:hypothetical protein [Streptomyces sp. NPDC051561]|uniref:hypothetical protein n=1 Tax=Streptomyces sp. NPDC051561 TaxID=3365658 RepID=UPI0037963D00